MCTLLLPPGLNQIAVKYIISYRIIYIISYRIIHIISYHIYHIIYHIISYHIIYYIISYMRRELYFLEFCNREKTNSYVRILLRHTHNIFLRVLRGFLGFHRGINGISAILGFYPASNDSVVLTCWDNLSVSLSVVKQYKIPCP